MNTFVRFFYEFISIFFEGIGTVITGIYSGFVEMFNIKEYGSLINNYKTSFKGVEWVFVVISVLILIFVLGLIIFLIYLWIRKIIRRSKNKLNNDELLDEIADLNEQVQKLMKEKDEIMAMKVSQLGLKPGESNTEEISSESEETGGVVSSKHWLTDAATIKYGM